MSDTLPSQITLLSVRIDTYIDRPSTTFFVITVQSATGETWQVEHRYSEFDALRSHLVYSFQTRTPFPPKHAVRRLFGFGDDMKDERRMELYRWLSEGDT